MTAFSLASAPDRQKKLFSSPGGVTSASSSPARSLGGEDGVRVDQQAARRRLGQRLAHARVAVPEARVPDHAAEVPPARAVGGREARALRRRRSPAAARSLARSRCRRRAPPARSPSEVAHAGRRRRRGTRVAARRPRRRRRSTARLRLGDDERRGEAGSPSCRTRAPAGRAGSRAARPRPPARACASSTPIIRPTPRTSVTLGHAAPASAAAAPSARAPTRAEFATSSLSSSSIVASPAAIATGLPAMVEPWLPAGQVMISLLRHHRARAACPRRSPWPAAGCRGRRRCARPRTSCPVRPMPRLHLVEHQQDAVAIGRSRAAAAGTRAAARCSRLRPAPARRRSPRRPRAPSRREQLLDAVGVAVGRVVDARQQRAEARAGTSTCWRSATATPASARGSRRGTR